MVYQVFRDTVNHWRWRLRAGNNRIVATSGEGYFNKADCYAAIRLVKGSSAVPIKEL